MSKNIDNEVIFHFGAVGRARLLTKTQQRGDVSFLNAFDKFCATDLKIKNKEVKYIGQVHGNNKHLGITVNRTPLPKYINIGQMMRDLKAPR